MSTGRDMYVMSIDSVLLLAVPESVIKIGQGSLVG